MPRCQCPAMGFGSYYNRLYCRAMFWKSSFIFVCPILLGEFIFKVSRKYLIIRRKTCYYSVEVLKKINYVFKTVQKVLKSHKKLLLKSEGNVEFFNFDYFLSNFLANTTLGKLVIATVTNNKKQMCTVRVVKC